MDFPEKYLAIISVDPSSRKSGGALLGDRIRMNAIASSRVYMRSLATRQLNLAMSRHVQESIDLCKVAGYDLVIVETSGIGQSDTEIIEHSDVSLLRYDLGIRCGYPTRKNRHAGFLRISLLSTSSTSVDLWTLLETCASSTSAITVYSMLRTRIFLFLELWPVNSMIRGVHRLYRWVMKTLTEKTGAVLESSLDVHEVDEAKRHIIPPARVRYLAEIVESSRGYDAFVREQVTIARKLYQVKGTVSILEGSAQEPGYVSDLAELCSQLEEKLHPDCKRLLEEWPAIKRRYQAPKYDYVVRGKTIEHDLYTESLSRLRIPKISLPAYEDWGRYPILASQRECSGSVSIRRRRLSTEASGGGPGSGCLQAKAGRSGPTNDFTTYPSACPPNDSRRLSIP